MGEVKITVSPKGAKPSTFTFRVKSLPDPVLRVGSTRKVRMVTAEFINQNYCGVDLESFMFDYQFKVISAAVYFVYPAKEGENIQPPVYCTLKDNSLAPAKAYMEKCVPGTTVTFDEVKVMGPEGPRIIDGYTITLY
ncbi:MAG: hypothetical protein FGM46_05980 [Ferruginibacter sp.]|nr:hypothetical protein [Ferruginibacter sp.]